MRRIVVKRKLFRVIEMIKKKKHIEVRFYVLQKYEPSKIKLEFSLKWSTYSPRFHACLHHSVWTYLFWFVLKAFHPASSFISAFPFTWNPPAYHTQRASHPTSVSLELSRAKSSEKSTIFQFQAKLENPFRQK